MTPVGSTYTMTGWKDPISFNFKLEVATCPSCGVPYGLPEEMLSRARLYNRHDYPDNTVVLYCPSGHQWEYKGTNSALAQARARAAELEAEVASKARALDNTLERLNEVVGERDHERARANGYKGVMVRTSKRLRAGVCPHCNRSGFEGDRLVRHITAKHPEAPAAS